MRSKKLSSVLPNKQSDEPNAIIAKDKKNLTAFLILIAIVIFINLIVAFVLAVSETIEGRTSAASIFMVITAAVIDLATLIICVGVAHNVSRTTSAVLKIAEKLLETKNVLGDTTLPTEVLDNTNATKSTSVAAQAITSVKNNNMK